MRSVADMMEAGSELIFERWLERVQRDHAPGELSRPELADHIPDFMREVVAALRREEEGQSPKTHRVGPLGWEHGEQRFRVGFDLPSMVREYGTLHDCIHEFVEEQGQALIRVEEVRVLVQCFNRAISEAVVHYTRIRERQLLGEEPAPPPG
ncbi:RsbRD N-terminal domain-containing protein [Archangium sp. Cb G35]|uniref:RsbRD N-terminal domain-containing protein n=1 Tax=Archangium sp. Cb G35 TaxID=1920190 RepID=UPI0009FA5741|nr:RsbRD N-terminal domain-containing protein [Archangium sp. Cb G35]